MTPAEFKAIRLALGLSQRKLGEVHLKGMSGRNIRRIEDPNGNGPYAAWVVDTMRDIDPRLESK